jgi:predicted choloylglycine hydrolase
MRLTFEAIDEPLPGARWQAAFRRLWPGYRRWFLRGGGHLGPSLAESERALRRHMPELVPVWERLVELAAGDALAARFLTGWCPPRYLVACSQAAWAGPDGVWLVRNYDLDPGLNEALLWRTCWGKRRVVAASECLVGVSDGINDAGIAVSLAFGGRRVAGTGFGIPFVVRYLLETAAATAEAVAILRRVPVHMAYNITLIDRSGEACTVMVGPDRPAAMTRPAVATNHQGEPEWPELARFSRTLERHDRLLGLLGDGSPDDERRVGAFLEPPLYVTDYARGFGTLYTAVWRPDLGEVELRWPDGMWRQSLDGFSEGRRGVRYDAVGARVQAAAARGNVTAAVDLRTPIGAFA